MSKVTAQSEPPDGYRVRVAIDAWTMDTPSVGYPYIPYLRIWYATRAEAIAACWAHKAHTPPRVLGSQESGAKDLNMNEKLKERLARVRTLVVHGEDQSFVLDALNDVDVLVAEMGRAALPIPAGE